MGFASFFTSLALIAICVHVQPFLSAVAKHGKVLASSDSDNQSTSSSLSHKNQSMIINLTRFFNMLTVPKRLFLYFYVLGCFIAVMFMIISLHGENEASLGESSRPDMLAALMLFGVHCFVRLWECLYGTEYGASRMHVTGFVVGLVHYVAVPLSMLFGSTGCDAFALCFGLMPSKYHSFSTWNISSRQNWSVRYAIATAVFIAASWYQYRCHSILAAMKRRSTAKSTGAHSEYRLPEGSLFELVCCPHYLCEVLIYASLALLLPTWSQLAVLLWVATNLAVVAQHHFEFYCKHFPDEMKRKGVRRMVPFLW